MKQNEVCSLFISGKKIFLTVDDTFFHIMGDLNKSKPAPIFTKCFYVVPYFPIIYFSKKRRSPITKRPSYHLKLKYSHHDQPLLPFVYIYP